MWEAGAGGSLPEGRGHSQGMRQGACQPLLLHWSPNDLHRYLGPHSGQKLEPPPLCRQQILQLWQQECCDCGLACPCPEQHLKSHDSKPSVNWLTAESSHKRREEKCFYNEHFIRIIRQHLPLFKSPKQRVVKNSLLGVELWKTHFSLQLSEFTLFSKETLLSAVLDWVLCGSFLFTVWPWWALPLS